MQYARKWKGGSRPYPLVSHYYALASPEQKAWRPAGLFHATASDDIYEGYFIPKGWYSPRVDLFPYRLTSVLRRGGTSKHMVWHLHHPFCLASIEPLLGRFSMTRSGTQNRIPSNPNGSSTQMEASLKIRCWQYYLGLENGSVPGDTWLILCFLLLSPLFSRFSTSKATVLMEDLISTHSRAAA